MPSTPQHTIVLVDDHALVRDGLAGFLDAQPDWRVVGRAGSAREGLAAVRKHRPALAIVDLSLGEGHGLELIKEIRNECPDTAVLVMSMHDELIYAPRVIKAGAAGYLMKKEPAERLLEAIRKVLQGGTYVSEVVRRDCLGLLGKPGGELKDGIEDLSDRELQVFRLLGDGMSTKGIATHLGLSVKTVETYRENLKLKLGLVNGAALIQRAVQWNRSHPE